MEQLGFDGMPERLYPCTPSRLNTWLECPRRYRMAYLDRPKPPKGPPWAHNSVGASVHNALAAWWRLPEPERTPAAAGTLLVRGWLTEGFRDDEQSAVHRERARDMVERYVAGLDPSDEPVGVERTVATRTARIAVSGRIDRLDARGGELVVVDYKTGRRPLTSDDARGSLALAIYAVGASRVLRRPCRRVELHHLPSGEVAAWDHTGASLDRHLGRAEDLAAEASAADDAYRERVPKPRRGDADRSRPVDHAPFDERFPARPGPLCAWCDFARHCPEGRAAAPRKEPWSALPVVA
ncbi:hypothetical protein GCM10010182_35500 [Actinomadura cremea]|nr:hypothetical protein GCM10010182_35500 [Actinomadura cremea]